MNSAIRMESQLRAKLKSMQAELVPHIFFPRKLPTESTDIGIAHAEYLLLELFHFVVEGVSKVDVIRVSISKTRKLFTKWKSIQLGSGFDVIRLTSTLKSLEPGDSIALYVRAQNAGLILFTPENDDTNHKSDQIILSAFAASQASETVTGADGEIGSTFPGYSYHIPKSALLESTAMGDQLSILCRNVQDFAAPHTCKAGSIHQETRDVSDPAFIVQWLPAVLSRQSSDLCFHYKPVTKKIRDQVVIGNSTLPFRRSGLWMAAKVVLQLSLISEMKNETQAKIIYKIIMLKLFTTCAQIWSEDLNADIGMQVIAKIARRMVKLHDYVVNNNVPNTLNEYFGSITCEAEGVIFKIQKRLETEWIFYISRMSLKSELNYKAPSDLKKVTIHKLKWLTTYIKVLNGTNYAASKEIVPNLPCPPRHRSTSSMFPVKNFEVTGEVNIGIVLNDFERNIEKLEKFYTTSHAVLLRELFGKYMRKAKQYYTDDPVGGSRMLLTLMKIIMVQDMFAVKEYPLLTEYKSGIDPSIIQELILPGRKEVIIAREIENYFLSRNNRAIYDSLIEVKSISETSFSARYASENTEMKNLRRKIEKKCKKNENHKKDEILKKREECRKLREEAALLSHETVKDKYGIYEHAPCCVKCNLEKQEAAVTVSVYERMLPADDDHKKDGVVFELMIPSDLAFLRDMLFKFTRIRPPSTSSSEGSLVGFWVEYLSQYQSESSENQKYVLLGSSTKLYKQTHYNRQRLHPDENMDSFVVNNGFNCNYFYNNDSNLPTIPSGSTIKDVCTFTVSPNSPYQDLQFALQGILHTQNQVLARQIECPAELALAEFVEFGSLRAGHRLQWHNIHRALAQGTLSLEAESVFSLICQTIWQAGPELENSEFWRETDHSIIDPNFAMMTLSLLDIELNNNSLNWKSHYCMAVIMVLANRIFLMTTTNRVQETALELLKKCRKVTTDWCASIEQLLSKMTLAPKEDLKDLRMRLVQIAALTALTFTSNSDNLILVLHDSNDVQSWFRSIAKIHDNILLTDSSLENLPKMLRNVLRWVRKAGIELEPHLRYLRTLDNGFDAFVKEQLLANVVIKPTPRRYEEESEQVYRCESQDSSVYQLDFIVGRFYVNGRPVGKLATGISEHVDFQRIFSGTVFEVREATGSSNIPGSVSTVLKFNQCIYNFYVSNGTLLVTEIHDDGTKFQLISHSQFEGDIPYLLIHKFSHWRDVDKNIIHFRPIDFSDPSFTATPEYTLNLNTRELIQIKTERRIVDITTTAYQHIAGIMERLEHRDQILVFSDNTKIIAELPRMALHFIVNKSGFIESKEYSGMCIAKTQQLETLIGLRNGILLESTAFDENMMTPVVLVPNGQVTVSSSGHSIHQAVNILTDSLGVPEYFAFEVDTRLKRLRAGQSRLGWLYLAYLHAITASPMPDPFLEMTGTEVALQLLQSPLCWSCEPLELGGLDILSKISDLSPRRTYYPPYLEVMETQSYPNYLSSAAAQDSFRIVVQKLVSDSQRLSFLFRPADLSCSSVEQSTLKKYNKLSLRAYRKHIALSNEHSRIDEGFCKTPAEAPEKLVASGMTHLHKIDITNVRLLAQLCASWSSIRTTDNSILTTLLCNQEKLEPLRMDIQSNFYTQAELLKTKFPHSWFDLYEIAKLVKERSWRSEWSLLLGQLAFGSNSIPFQHLNLLHTIAINPETFKLKTVIPYCTYNNTDKYRFNSTAVKPIIESCELGFHRYFSSKTDTRYRTSKERKKYVNNMKLEYSSLVKTQVEEIARILDSQFSSSPTKSCPNLSIYSWVGNASNVIDFPLAQSKLNPVFANWYENLQLHDLLVEIELLIRNVDKHSLGGTVIIRSYHFDEFERHRNSSLPVRTVFKKLLNNTLDHLMQANHSFTDHILAEVTRNVFQTGQSTNTELIDMTVHMKNFNLSPSLKAVHNANADHLFEYVKKVILTSSNSMPYKNVLCAAGLFPRLTPTTLIPKICSDELKSNRIRDLLGAVAVLWTLDQKEIRCVKLKHAGSMEFAIRKEQENDGHKLWSPAERPEWLLLELDMDIMIRQIQVEVAESMLHPLNKKSSLMQLNMGEGKTSVILPILIASLANGKQLARVTVLKSLFNTNTEVLRFNLGGLLNRRLYNFPCRRDIGIAGEEAIAMLEVYEECVNKRGFVATLPEHRLSFQLKGYEKCRSGSADAVELVRVQEWLYENARDVLDESDEILNVKYQLIYTIGEQLPINGGSARWIVLQKVLKLIPKRLLFIVNCETGISDLGECRHIEQKSENGPEIFPQCRIFKPQCYEELCTLLVDDILKGKSEVLFPELNSAKQRLVFEFLTKASVTPKLHSDVLALFSTDTVSSAHLDTLLILRGLFACGVLHLGLTKRWRVNYGENPKAKEFSRLMAVPYRAKDVASEKTEFGHPDVAILLTQLSYYYSGLSDSQLTDTFVCLFRQPKPDLEYNYWIRKMKTVHPSILSLSGVNLDDYEQRTQILFPSLRRNMFVIDFWLNHFVYPRESKVFGHKLISSAWDLCSDIAKHPVTGFSGTNDTAKLLPLHISQNDLPKLMGTNEEVRGYILRVENNHYEVLSTGFSGMDILKKLVRMKIPMLLDVGALILELSNAQVAEEWLKLIPDNEKFEAAVYFDSMDRLMVKDRLGRESKLELSPYKTRLGHCVIYLDDVHTRGTDLKIPPGTKGCLTLGKGVTRDKLVQGCMRMRLLGKENGHSLQFLASQEVHNEICTMHTGSKFGWREIEWNEKVLSWASRNSDIAIKDGFLHWVNAGLNYIRKEMAHLLFNDFSNMTFEDYLSYGNRCSDAEATELMAMYGEFRAEEFFFKIAENRLNYQQKCFLDTLNSAERILVRQIVSKLRAGSDAIVAKCQEHIPEVKKLAYLLDEEQERELEHELEEERQAPRPPSAQPWPNTLDPTLKRFVEGGTFAAVRSACLMQLPEVFQTTKLWSATQPKCWGGNIYATQDFFRVVEIPNKTDRTDQYLRPPTWIMSFANPNKIKGRRSSLIFLSPFEANELMPIFRSGKSELKLHMFSPRVHPKQDTLLRSPELWIPSATTFNVKKYFEGFNQLNSNLLLFSGSQYFADEEEQTAYCQLTGHIPRPRTDAEQMVFDQDRTVNGFVKPEYRRDLDPTLHASCQFKVNPEKLIFGIIERRHEGFATMSHVNRIVADSTKELFEKK